MKWFPAFVFLALTVVALSYAVNPIPGYEYMFAGYDIRYAESKSIVNGIKYPIFVPSYTMHQTYNKPNSTIVYDVPDQFYAYPIYETNVLTTTDIYQDVTAMLTEEITSFSIGIGFNIDGFGIQASISHTEGFIHYIFNEKDKFGAKGHLDTRTTKFVLGPYPLMTLNPYFDTLLNQKIPQCPKTAEDLANVQLLIQIWGHVFPTDLFLGGRFDCVTSLDESLLNKYDKNWVFTQLSLKFTYEGFDLYAGGFINKTDIKINKIFEEATKTSLFFVGGAESLQTNQTEKQWFQSVPDYPGLIYGSFSPISALVFNDPVKQRNLEYMLTQQINTGKIMAPPCSMVYPVDGQRLPPIPGTPFVGAGYDSLTMTPKGFIVEHTYGSQTWTNPFYPQDKYVVPDTLYVWGNSDNFEENYTSIAMSNSEFQVQLQIQVKGSDFLGFGKHSSDMYVFQYYHELHDSVENTNLRSLSWFDLELSPLVQIDVPSHFTLWANDVFSNLGRDISDPMVKAQYFRALDFYGDSLVTRVSMGGSLSYKGYMNHNVLNETTIAKFTEESGFSFFGLFGSKSSYDNYEKEISASIKENLKVEINANGGFWAPTDPALKKRVTGGYSFDLKDINQPLLDWDSFATSVKDNMVPIKYQIVPLYTIFSDPVISNNFKVATLEYLNARLNK